MVDQARVKAESLSSDARARLQVSAMDAADLPRVFSPGVFDVVVCHTLIEYLPDPEAILTILAPLLKPGGVFSLSFVNRTAEVLRQVVRKQDLVAARRALTTGGFRASLFGISGTAYAVEDVVDWMANLGFAIIASYGIRILADHLPPASLADPDFFGELLDLEADLSRCQSFLPTARYVNLVCSRAVET
jgi:S-adenosylmethionine-dependent methyltransferase